MFHVVGDVAEALDALAALRHGVVFAAHHGDARHVQQEARIDAVIAGLDAVAGEQAPRCPFARRVVAVTVAQDVDDAVDDVNRILPLFGREPGRDRGRADFDAFAAARAGIGHGIGARLQGGFECLSGISPMTWSVSPTQGRLKAPKVDVRPVSRIDARPPAGQIHDKIGVERGLRWVNSRSASRYRGSRIRG